MELAILSSRIIAYRAYTGLGQAHFAKRVGASLNSLVKLENGSHLPKSTCDPFIAALKKRTIHPGQPLPCLKRKATPAPVDSGFAQVELPVSIKDEQAALLRLVSKYLVRVKSWAKCHPKKGSTNAMVLLAEQFLEPAASTQRLPYQRQCLVIGMLQGMMLIEGILSATEALEDHNTLYYVS